LGGAKGIGLVVLGLEVLPAAELVLVLDFDAGHDGFFNCRQIRAVQSRWRNVVAVSPWPWLCSGLGQAVVLVWLPHGQWHHRV
jgi:hypothetical protein